VLDLVEMVFVEVVEVVVQPLDLLLVMVEMVVMDS
jgi:hypothetical protein